MSTNTSRNQNSKLSKLIPPSVPAAAKVTDVSHIKGNAPDDLKRLGLNVFNYFVGQPGKSYGAEVGKQLQVKECNVWGEGNSAYGETIFEIEVTPDMCNIFGTLHGACAAYIIDPCSVSSLVTLGLHVGIDGAGLSQTMNIIWHKPAPPGTKLKIISTSMFIKGRVRTARCEIWDEDNLCVSAVHTTINPFTKRTEKSKL